jgi:hypothetical protein
MGFPSSSTEAGAKQVEKLLPKQSASTITPPPAPKYETLDYGPMILAEQRKRKGAMSLGSTMLTGGSAAAGSAPVARKTLLGQ